MPATRAGGRYCLTNGEALVVEISGAEGVRWID